MMRITKNNKTNRIGSQDYSRGSQQKEGQKFDIGETGHAFAVGIIRNIRTSE
jgi:hypothetical protein